MPKKLICLLLAAVMLAAAIAPASGLAASGSKSAGFTPAESSASANAIDSDGPVDVVIIYDDAAKGEMSVKSAGIGMGLKSVSNKVAATQLAAGADYKAEIERLNALPGVKKAFLSTVKCELYGNSPSPAAYTGNDPDMNMQWWFSDVQADKVYGTLKGGKAVKVAVIDTGVDTDHPDLAARLLAGYDYAMGDKNVNHDWSDHGTCVAGCIVGVPNNGIGICGVAGDANVKVIPYKVEDTVGDLLNPAIVAAIYAAIDADVDVINMSFGFSDWEYNPNGGYDDGGIYYALQEAAAAGITLVAAAGNDGNTDYSYPASYKNVISVAATTSVRGSSIFSQYNSAVDISAPGADIWTLADGGNYSYIDGTSFSSPITAGICAMMISKANKSISPAKVEQILKDTATTDNLYDDYYERDWFGAGIVQAADALKRIQGSISAPQNVKAVVKNATSIKVSWNAVSGATKYVIYRKEGSGDWKALTSTTGTSATFTTGLKPGYNYRFRIYAKNAVSTSAGSDIALVKFVPPAPTKFAVESTTATTAKLNWTKTAGAYAYCVYYKRSDDAGYTYYGATTGNSITVKNLDSGARYAFRVRAYVKATTGVYAGTNVFGPYTDYSSAAILGAPRNLQIVDNNGGKARLQWGKLTGAYAYCVYYKRADDTGYTYYGATLGNVVTIPNLSSGYRYAFKVRAYSRSNLKKAVFGPYCTYVADWIY